MKISVGADHTSDAVMRPIHIEVDSTDIRDEFRVHFLNAQGLAKATDLASLFSAFLGAIEIVVGPTNLSMRWGGTAEMAIVQQKLQEASFYAKRAMAKDPANQETVR